MRKAVAWVVFGLLGACNAAPNVVPHDASTESMVDVARIPRTGPVNYYEHVRPVLTQNCIGCHQNGGVGGFDLTTYDTARVRSAAIVGATASRRMPPFLADNSGACNTYRDALWLSDDDLDVLRLWHEQATPEGDPQTPAPTPRVWPTLEGLTTTDITMPAEYEPRRETTDDYRCFVVDHAITGFITGYQVAPGNASIVHHVIVYSPQSDSAASQARAADTAEAGEGYTCYGGSGVNAVPVVLWAPGGGALRFPEGTGVQVSPSRPLIIQVHYNSSVTRGTDRTRITLAHTPSAIPAYILPIANTGFRLEPRMPEVTSTFSQILPRLPVPQVRIYGSFPHMHTLGQQLRASVRTTVDGESQESCLMQIPRWDFNWQRAYFFERPITVQQGAEVRISCTWNTMTRDSVVTWGEGTSDEMCINFVYVSL